MSLDFAGIVALVDVQPDWKNPPKVTMIQNNVSRYFILLNQHAPRDQAAECHLFVNLVVGDEEVLWHISYKQILIV